MSTVTLVKAVQTCTAAPSQWDAWDSEGRYWYLRFRFARGTMGRDYAADELSFELGDESEHGLDGEISLEEFCERIGVTLALGSAAPALEAPPPLPGTVTVTPEEFDQFTRKHRIRWEPL